MLLFSLLLNRLGFESAIITIHFDNNTPMTNLPNLQVTLGSLILVCLSCTSAAQNQPLTPAAPDAPAVAAPVVAGVPLSAVADSAPDRYTIRTGDTLWALAQMFLKSPWRWPELWNLNKTEISNPHRIYPGQTLELVRSNGMASLRLAGGGNASATPDTVRLSPRTRYQQLSDLALPSLRPDVIEPFLAEPIVVDADTLRDAPRIVAATDSRVLLTQGDRAYARGAEGTPLLDDQTKQKQFRIFRNATPLKDPGSNEVLGYEAQYIGKAVLVRGETTTEIPSDRQKMQTVIVPASLDIVSAKEEIRVGDRLLPEPERQWLTYTPHAPAVQVQGRIISVYGTAVVNAAQNQVVAINLGTQHGIEPGHVVSILKDGATLRDTSAPGRPLMKLPDEHNGLMMVFRTFNAVSYALVLDISQPVRVGDRFTNPR
jgi:LysM repeat protein